MAWRHRTAWVKSSRSPCSTACCPTNVSCPAKGFYTYDAFIAAANSFPAFGTSGTVELMKREVAAFFGQTSQETTGRPIAADGQYQWGYCYKEANETFKESGSRPYYGRGPLQLEWDFNYKAAGKALGVDLVSNPDLVSTDPVISFKTAIWFWMTPQSPQPSCHDVITGNWKPRTAAEQVPGYGVISQIINGGIECGKVPSNVDNINRIGYYKRYCDMLGVGTGDNLDCYTLQNFPDLEAPPVPPQAPPASQLKTIILSSVLGSAAVIVIIAAAAYLYFTSKYRRWRKEQDKLAKAMHNLPGMPTRIDYAEIRKATKGFHATMKLGKGGFGAVYRCTLPAAAASSRTGQAMEVAVKKFMRELEDRRYNDFLVEVS
ncbi:hypothetical protein PR202_ga25068 [Eleusine coracana subsp. coracana]|uniref:chitinase n=1 Tax=Eleusine coracana subsp. coracana TaxID=191504 RepID=A0AAV5DA20_ELECO|nr:hypothetical protein PR202_ga25068 [Eleusine coracana subsp. coracana]